MASGWWKFERVFKDSFTNTGLTSSGRFACAVGGSTIKVYDTHVLEEMYRVRDDFVQPEGQHVLSAMYTITLPGNGYHITHANDKLYTSAGKSFSQIYVSNLHDVLDTIVCPESMQSNIHYYNGELWMVGQSLSSNLEHTVYYYNIIDKTWDSILLPVRHQVAQHYISDDKNGNILITQHNNLSVSKIVASTHTYTNTTRLDDGSGANREPEYIYTDSDYNVYVGSINGMVSMLNTTTNVVDHQYNSLGQCKGMVCDGTYLWYATGTNLIRQNLSDNAVRILTHLNPDHTESKEPAGAQGDIWEEIDDVEQKYNITDPNVQWDKLSQGQFHFRSPLQWVAIDESVCFDPNVQWDEHDVKRIVKTLAHSYETNAGTQTVGEYIFVASDDNVYAFRNDELFYRDVYTKIDGVGMISQGPYDYTGD